MSIGERILQLRKEQNISQGSLADTLDISRQAISKWENDLSSPDTINLIKLAEVLDADVEYLATGRRSYHRRPPVVLKTVETVERIVEKPVYRVVEKVVDRPVEKPIIQYIDREIIKEVPVLKKVYRKEYRRNLTEYVIVGVVALLAGILIGVLI